MSNEWYDRIVSYVRGIASSKNRKHFCALRKTVANGMAAPVLTRVGILPNDPFWEDRKEKGLAIAAVVCAYPEAKCPFPVEDAKTRPSYRLGKDLKRLLGNSDSALRRFNVLISARFSLASKLFLRISYRAKNQGDSLNLYGVARVLALWDARDPSTDLFFVREELCDGFFSA